MTTRVEERVLEPLLDALLDSWDRNNTILVNLLRAVPEGGLALRAMEGSPSIAELFTHIHYVRLVFVFEDAPEFARDVPAGEWVAAGHVAAAAPRPTPGKRHLRRVP